MADIRDIVGKDPFELARDYVATRNDNLSTLRDDREDLDGTYTGKVVNNDDPDKQGKCQIRVYSIYGEKVPDEDLPWALPDFDFVGSKVGSFVVPPVGALVKVYFDHGDIYLPHYTTKATDINNLPETRLSHYPHTMVMYETDDGDSLVVDRKSKDTIVTHSSGTTITIRKSGDVEIDAKGKSCVIKATKFVDCGGAENSFLGGNIPVLYSKTPGIPITDFAQIGSSETVKVGL